MMRIDDNCTMLDFMSPIGHNIIMRKSFWSFSFLLLSVMCATRFVSAETSVGMSVSGGVEQSGIDLNGALDLGSSDENEALADVAAAHSKIATESHANQPIF